MNRLALIAFVLGFGVCGYCPEALATERTYAASDVEGITRAEGEFASVSGVVKTASVVAGGEVRKLIFGIDYRSSFQAVVFSGDLEAFMASLGDPVPACLHRKVTVEGRIELYKGQPQIVLRRPEQVRLHDELSKVEGRFRAEQVEELVRQAGRYVTVKGKVDNVYRPKSGKVRMLNFGKDWKKCFTVPIFSGSLGYFQEQGEPADYYRGRVLEVTGYVHLYKGKPEITVVTPEQIKIMEQ